jgi:hypothetical protein
MLKLADQLQTFDFGLVGVFTLLKTIFIQHFAQYAKVHQKGQ